MPTISENLDKIERLSKSKKLIPLRLNQCTFVSNPEKFVKNHLLYSRSYTGHIQKAYYLRLVQYFKILNDHENEKHPNT